MSNAFKSGAWGTANFNNLVQKEIQYIFNISYDVNPAMRLGIQLTTSTRSTRTMAPRMLLDYYADRDGKLNAIRVGAW